MSPTVVMRSPRPDEATAVRSLAYLDSARPLRGEVVAAFVLDRPVAAVSLADGRVVADPFVPTADVVELLREHAAGPDGGRTVARRHAGLRRFRLRFAH
jgi:hypothetical protein